MTRSTRSRSRRAPETKPLPLDLPKDESGEDLLPHKPLVVIVGRPNVGKSTPVSYTHLTLPTTPYV